MVDEIESLRAELNRSLGERDALTQLLDKAEARAEAAEKALEKADAIRDYCYSHTWPTGAFILDVLLAQYSAARAAGEGE
jgi:hypothetical protein